MDIPRYALIAASVLLGLMLLGEWTRFTEEQQTAALPAVPMVATAENNFSAASTPRADSDLPVKEDVNLASVSYTHLRAHETS